MTLRLADRLTLVAALAAYVLLLGLPAFGQVGAEVGVSPSTDQFLETADLLTEILAVDGSGSGIDADTIDTVQASNLPKLSSGPRTFQNHVKVSASSSSDSSLVGVGPELQSSGGSSYLISYDRTGAAYAPLILQGSDVQLSDAAGTASLTFNGVDLVPATGTFSLTLSTGCATTPSGTATYARVGNVVVLELPLVQCTSNTGGTATSFTGVPSAILPTTNQTVGAVRVEDNGTEQAGCYQILAAGGFNVLLGDDCNTIYTTSGNRGINPQTITYLLN